MAKRHITNDLRYRQNLQPPYTLSRVSVCALAFPLNHNLLILLWRRCVSRIQDIGHLAIMARHRITLLSKETELLLSELYQVGNLIHLLRRVPGKPLFQSQTGK